MLLLEINNLSSISHILEENFSISSIDLNGVITYVNQNFCYLSEYSEAELIGKNYGMLYPEYKLESYIHELIRKLTNDKVCDQQRKMFAKDGTPFWVQANIIPVFDKDNKITQFVSLDIDITNRIHTEKRYEKMLSAFNNIENALNQSSVVAITNRSGIITYVNEKFCELSKYSAAELIGNTHRIVNSGYHSKKFFKEMWQTIGNGGIWKGKIKNQAKDGTVYWVNTTIVPFLNEEGKPFQYISIRTDITDQKKSEEALQIALKNDFRHTVKNLQNAVFKYKTDDTGKIVFTLIEGKLAENLGITTTNIFMNEVNHSLSENEIKHYELQLRKGLLGKEVHFELSFFQFTYLFYLTPIFENNEVIEVVGTMSDISERKEAEKLVEHMAYFDYLTALPNRRLFKQRVDEAIRLSQLDNRTFGVMFIDLDNFKHFNDTRGHTAGDQLLTSVGERLNNCVRNGDVVARHGGDEYVILLPSVTFIELEAKAKDIVNGLSQPFYIDNLEVFTSSSIGISMFPKDGNDYDTLIRNADSAMYIAKDSGECTYNFFTKDFEYNAIDKKTLEMDLRLALQKNQFELHYQPIINLETGKLSGTEALIRWQHPSKGIISPEDFIPIAEETGLIVQIGKWVLETACLQAKTWNNDGFTPICMHVNVSTRQFKQKIFVSQVQETLSKTGLQPKFLNLEITESMTFDVQQCQMILHKLRDIGVNISIDDFGTGYSSLSYLSTLPITHLKIDQAFIQNLNNSNRAIVKTIIDLAKNLELNVIAEGVETSEQVNFLKNLQCHKAQGYFYSKPIPSKSIQVLLEKKED